MPRALKSDKFFIYAPTKVGYGKGTRLMGVNHLYKGSINLQDLLDFLKKHEIDPARVPVSTNFIVNIGKGKS